MLKVFRLWIIDPLAIDDEGARFPRRHQRQRMDAEGLVVVAPNELGARDLATMHSIHDEWWWAEPSLTECEEIDLNGKGRVLMALPPDF